LRKAKEYKFLTCIILFSLLAIILFSASCWQEEVSDRLSSKRGWSISSDKFKIGDIIQLTIAVQIKRDLLDFLPPDEESCFNLIMSLSCPDGGYIVYNVTFCNAPYYTQDVFDVSSAEILEKHTVSVDVLPSITDIHGNIRLGIVRQKGNYTVNVYQNSGWWLEREPYLHLYFVKVIYPYRWLYIPAIPCVLFAGFFAVYYVRKRYSVKSKRRILRRY